MHRVPSVNRIARSLGQGGFIDYGVLRLMAGSFSLAWAFDLSAKKDLFYPCAHQNHDDGQYLCHCNDIQMLATDFSSDLQESVLCKTKSMFDEEEVKDKASRRGDWLLGMRGGRTETLVYMCLEERKGPTW